MAARAAEALAQRDEAIKLLRAGQAKGWGIWISEVGPSPYNEKDVVVVVNSNWLALSRGNRLKLATDVYALFRRAYPRGHLHFWDADQNRVAARKLLGGIELIGED